jgi:hypothetical protein
MPPHPNTPSSSAPHRAVVSAHDQRASYISTVPHLNQAFSFTPSLHASGPEFVSISSEPTPAITTHSFVTISGATSPPPRLSSSAYSSPTTTACRMPDCKKTYNRIYDLLRHITSGAHRATLLNISPNDTEAAILAAGIPPKYVPRAMQLLVRSHRCEVCGEVFARGDVFKRHRRLMGHGPVSTSSSSTTTATSSLASSPVSIVTPLPPLVVELPAPVDSIGLQGSQDQAVPTQPQTEPTLFDLYGTMMALWGIQC